ncbi:hypothetical protein RO3G_00804 [Rhizopus delemar RA 99-880]|uniref:Uncharacterized protein n=1 Tax=Rhizopus delemar (strain RA 99-880 / ATCC MYA-4621 / FGSC 9543 / NRRL 43880) TaxID=246409 RepID=I1BIS0_RHIO9|nr:hypothetical protein RO3G_00804 [Rhizopus delemar RA 99-880]|eukprot:EIE76100.1 hypothetical protein RO3G_00804 [Rhizopus delemar RA 99-880]
MVRFKHRWILFQVIQDPIIENGQVVYPKTSLRLTDQMISRAIYNQVEIYYGQYGKGLGSIAASIPCSLSILRVSGTIIFIQTAAIEWDREHYLKEQEEAEKKG